MAKVDEEDYFDIPWDLLKEKHIIQYGYSGSIIKALRIKNNYRAKDLASLLHKRRSTLKKIEETDKIGIALAKKLAKIFGLMDWRVLRNKPEDLDFFLNMEPIIEE